jgi:hypothetical protein
VLNTDDNCPNVAGTVGGCPDQLPFDPRPAAADDIDGDGIPNNADVDRDGDGIWNRPDKCPAKPGPDPGCPVAAPPPAPEPVPVPPPPPPPPSAPPPVDTTPTTTETVP